MPTSRWGAALAIDHRNAADLRVHQLKRFAKGALGRDGQRVHHHAGFIFLYPRDFGSLGFDVMFLWITPMPPAWAMAMASGVR